MHGMAEELAVGRSGRTAFAPRRLTTLSGESRLHWMVSVSSAISFHSCSSLRTRLGSGIASSLLNCHVLSKAVSLCRHTMVAQQLRCCLVGFAEECYTCRKNGGLKLRCCAESLRWGGGGALWAAENEEKNLWRLYFPGDVIRRISSAISVWGCG